MFFDLCSTERFMQKKKTKSPTCQNYYASRTDLVKYGLDKDSRITVDITYKDTDTKKTKNVVLYIGKKDSDQKNYYVQLKGSHMVYLSDKDVVKNILNP